MTTNDTQLTQHFKRSEFACKDGCGFDQIDPRLVGGLETMRQEIGLPIIISSGCRCAKWNKHEGGAEHSTHLQGMAADLQVHGMTARELYAVARHVGVFRGFGVDDRRQMLHVDTRAIIARWCYDANGKSVVWHEAK